MNKSAFRLITVAVFISQGFFFEKSFADENKAREPKVEFRAGILELGNQKIKVEYAENNDQHMLGLMNRKTLDENSGMLFIFPDEATRSFWMKNTMIDLSIGYFDKNKKLIDVKEMKSGVGVDDDKLPIYRSAKPAKYALEMKPGWFDRKKIKLSTVFKIKK